MLPVVSCIAFSCCPTPSGCHCYRLVDCRIVRAADATSSASYSSSSLLGPHFCTHPPPSPPADRHLRAAFLLGVPLSGDMGERALEGAPAAVVVIGHPATFDGDGQSPLLRHSYSRKKRGRATDGPKNKRDCGTKQHKPAQNGTNRHKTAQNGTNFCAAQMLGGEAFFPHGLL